MTNEEILTKAVERVVKNGYKLPDGDRSFVKKWGIEMADIGIEMFFQTGIYKQIIFSHDFAKAFWGEKDYWKYTECTCGGVDPHIVHDGHKLDCSKVQLETEGKRGYKLHLQLMVLEEEPIQYLEKFL